MKEFVDDAIKIAMANHQLFTQHHNVQNAHDVMAHYVATLALARDQGKGVARLRAYK